MVTVGRTWHRADRRAGESRGRDASESAAAEKLAAGLYLVCKMAEDPAGPEFIIYSGVNYPLLSLFVGASSTTEGLECQARQRRTQSNRRSRRSPSPV